jgi:hypothetical protein
MGRACSTIGGKEESVEATDGKARREGAIRKTKA